MRVLVIPEDFRKDQYMLKPLVEALMAAAGRPKARVEVCTDPLLGGIDQALRWDSLKDVIEQHRGMVDLFLLCVDRDGKAGRRAQLDALEAKAAAELGSTAQLLLAENAWQELEVWVLAGHDLPADWVWREIRAEPNPKEIYFEPFARQRGVLEGPGGGRKVLAREAAARYDRILRLCPEDVGALDRRVREWVEGR
jgi:hypothetical protein